MHNFNRKWLGILAMSSLGLFAAGCQSQPTKTAQQAAPSSKSMFMETESPFGYSETVEAMKAEFSAAGWSVLATHELHTVLAKKGHQVQPVAIMEACSGKYSVKLLKKDDTRYISSMMPCRVSIYQTSTGKVIISRMNSPQMASMMDPEVAEVMNQASAGMESVIAKVLAKK